VICSSGTEAPLRKFTPEGDNMRSLPVGFMRCFLCWLAPAGRPMLVEGSGGDHCIATGACQRSTGEATSPRNAGDRSRPA
jgi:hypothetical protein